MNLHSIVTPEHITSYIDALPGTPAEHLRPLLIASRDAGIRLVFIDQGCKAEHEIKPDDPTSIYLVGDDLLTAQGPFAFRRKLIRNAARRSVGAIIVAAEAAVPVYAAAAAVASGGKALMQGDKQINGSVIIVETQPYQERAWGDFLKRANPLLAFLIVTTRPGGEKC